MTTTLARPPEIVVEVIRRLRPDVRDAILDAMDDDALYDLWNSADGPMDPLLTVVLEAFDRRRVNSTPEPEEF